MRFSKRNCVFCFCLSYVAVRETEENQKIKRNKAQKPTKIVFLRWLSKNEKSERKWIFGKGEKTRIFVHTICFGQKVFDPKQ